MPARKKSSRKYGKAAGKSVESAMRRKKHGTLRSGKAGKGGKVTSRKQAIAIGLSEARKKGAKVPANRVSEYSHARLVGTGGFGERFFSTTLVRLGPEFAHRPPAPRHRSYVFYGSKVDLSSR